MKVKMLRACEDSNEFIIVDPENPDPLLEGQDFTIGRVARGRVVSRVDRLKENEEYDLPSEQAQKLINLGIAEAI